MKKTNSTSNKRREFIKTGSYVVPAVLTLVVRPSFAAAASGAGGGVAGGADGSRGTSRFGSRPR